MLIFTNKTCSINRCIFFPALQMLQQLWREVTGGLCAPTGSCCKESHTTKACRCFPYLCVYSFWNASVEMHLAYCLKKYCLAMQAVYLSFNCPPTLNQSAFYVIYKGHGYNTSLWTWGFPPEWEAQRGKVTQRCGNIFHLDFTFQKGSAVIVGIDCFTTYCLLNVPAESWTKPSLSLGNCTCKVEAGHFSITHGILLSTLWHIKLRQNESKFPKALLWSQTV